MKFYGKPLPTINHDEYSLMVMWIPLQA